MTSEIEGDVFVVEQACPYEEVDGRTAVGYVYLKDETE